jgi:hypothetical protein
MAAVNRAQRLVLVVAAAALALAVDHAITESTSGRQLLVRLALLLAWTLLSLRLLRPDA